MTTPAALVTTLAMTLVVVATAIAFRTTERSVDPLSPGTADSSAVAGLYDRFLSRLP
jgi:hypothetical protein